MEKRDTQKIVEELKLCPDFKTFYDENRQYMVDASLNDMLCELMDKEGLLSQSFFYFNIFAECTKISS